MYNEIILNRSFEFCILSFKIWFYNVPKKIAFHFLTNENNIFKVTLCFTIKNKLIKTTLTTIITLVYKIK